MTDALKDAFRANGQSLCAIAKATGLNEDSLSRFMRGGQSFRLDLADRLAAHIEIEIKREDV